LDLEESRNALLAKPSHEQYVRYDVPSRQRAKRAMEHLQVAGIHGDFKITVQDLDIDECCFNYMGEEFHVNSIC